MNLRLCLSSDEVYASGNLFTPSGASVLTKLGMLCDTHSNSMVHCHKGGGVGVLVGAVVGLLAPAFIFLTPSGAGSATGNPSTAGPPAFLCHGQA